MYQWHPHQKVFTGMGGILMVGGGGGEPVPVPVPLPLPVPVGMPVPLPMPPPFISSGIILDERV
jgi:hypothetical protein